MPFHVVEPEVAGGLGENTVLDASVHPPVVSHLHYDFEGWLGGELVQAFPVYLVSERLRDALRDRGATGIEFAEAEVTESESFPDAYQGPPLPRFVWMKVHGEAGRDDFGMSSEHRLVVSDQALDTLRRFPLSDAEISPYRP